MFMLLNINRMQCFEVLCNSVAAQSSDHLVVQDASLPCYIQHHFVNVMLRFMGLKLHNPIDRPIPHNVTLMADVS